MNKTDFTKWREVKAYVDWIMTTNIKIGKLIVEYDKVVELYDAQRALTNVTMHWRLPIRFMVRNGELYFQRTDLA